jgi:hypothetical protein
LNVFFAHITEQDIKLGAPKENIIGFHLHFTIFQDVQLQKEPLIINLDKKPFVINSSLDSSFKNSHNEIKGVL